MKYVKNVNVLKSVQNGVSVMNVDLQEPKPITKRGWIPMTDKVARNIGAYKASSQQRLGELTEYIIDEIYKITEDELTKIYPEKNWYEDNFGANLFALALQISAQVQSGVVLKRANEITEMQR